MDESRFRAQQSPRNEAPMNSFVSPPLNGSRLPPPSDPRSNLPRRFTTDLSRVPTLSSLASPSRAAEPSNQDFQVYQKTQLIEQKKAEYERIREQRRRFELEMQRLDQQQRREALELAQMEEDLRMGGHQSEPTTPPEYRDNPNGFPSMFSRPNRYSMSSMTSPPGLFNRSSRSGSQITSPRSGFMQGRLGLEDQAKMQMPSRSTPVTRRNSDDEKEETVRLDPTSHRPANASNRYSLPATHSGYAFYDPVALDQAGTLDQTNTTRFLFGDEERSPFGHRPPADESFPTLTRSDQILSASSAALDLALSPSPNPESSSRGWSRVVNRHRPQQSLSSVNGASSQATDVVGLNNRPGSLRHSVDFKFLSESVTEAVIMTQANPNAVTPPRLQSSYSANDVPTVKNSAGPSLSSPNANNHAQQHFHNHNASLGRIPAGAVPRGHNRELSNDNATVNREQANAFQSITSALQASAAPFGPTATAVAPPPSTIASSQQGGGIPVANGFNSFYQPTGYPSTQGAHPPGAPGGYNVNALAVGMQQISMAGVNGVSGVNGANGANGANGIGGMNGMNGGGMYSAQNYAGYGAVPFSPNNQPRDSQARVIQHRRQLDNEAMSRYQNMPLESFVGQIYDLCKDQHGCRFLQKKLEERVPDQVHTIWRETNHHVVELMTDPFGNYLCQKLLEYCNDDERTVLIQNSSLEMVRIALNQHGTRALQKMIEFVNTPQQVQLIIEALRGRVVDLIQDLNGNHVIQKCLNKLTATDSQFIFDAVGENCVAVGTHRHGCCVLQRCIDHASGEQKLWLIKKITEVARVLVQDPFGNYVVQYIIDLNEPTFTEPVVATFRGCIGQLSRHKFSSNVIEKCLRCAQPLSKDMIVEEMLAPSEMEKNLRDSFANYVVQTALEYATPGMKTRLVDTIRPLLPAIRNTPYGRRIQAKISAYDGRGNAISSGQITPADNNQGQISARSGPTRGMSMSTLMSVLQEARMANVGPEGIRPEMLYTTIGAPSPATGPGQQQQFAQQPPVTFSPAHPVTNDNGDTSNGGNGSAGNGTVNGAENGDTHWV